MLIVIGSHIAIMSQLGHKELRFISYLNPILNVFAAKAVVALWSQDQDNNPLSRMASRTIVLLSLAATALVTVMSLIASANNYPGGEAMQVLHGIIDGQNGKISLSSFSLIGRSCNVTDAITCFHTATVHIDILPAMTGVNLFQSLHLSRPQSAFGISWLPSVVPSIDHDNLLWTYDKTEKLSEKDDKQWQAFTLLISDTRSCHLPDSFDLLLPDAFVEFEKLSLKSPKQWISSLAIAPKTCLQDGLLHWPCFDSLLPVYFRWREAVWLCRRKN